MTKTVLGVCVAAAMALASNIEITGFDYPESVLVDGNRVAVSNVGKQPLPMEKDGDGYISLLNTDGKILEKEFVKGLHSPKGMAFVRHGLGGTLYVADVNEIKGFNSNSKKEVFSLAIEGAMFLNDIAKKDDKTLFFDFNRVIRPPEELNITDSSAGSNGMDYLLNPQLFVEVKKDIYCNTHGSFITI